ncbi:OPA3-domain-containing protein [Fistulina hepatica ATCC 64428]|uniref:OPA3-domain-containing protein n=1 Tax=Fistulina hepatica ATCC 64428 TaxID=1128425 RepID=A0A0D7AL21_9AGAR|nr:OPA3-domain-containing protein [Fistulina hepatica ATCC 64428]
MASVTTKIAQLAIRTLAKPISAQIKHQAKQHESFRKLCMNIAQRMHRTEIKLRTNILGETAKHVRPLSEQRAIDNGANVFAEGFLFTVATLLIIAETWRSSRNKTRQKEGVDERLDMLTTNLVALTARVDVLSSTLQERLTYQEHRSDRLTRVLERVVNIGLRGGLTELENALIQLPRIPPEDDESDNGPVSVDSPASPSKDTEIASGSSGSRKP